MVITPLEDDSAVQVGILRVKSVDIYVSAGHSYQPCSVCVTNMSPVLLRTNGPVHQLCVWTKVYYQFTDVQLVVWFPALTHCFLNHLPPTASYQTAADSFTSSLHSCHKAPASQRCRAKFQSVSWRSGAPLSLSLSWSSSVPPLKLLLSPSIYTQH